MDPQQRLLLETAWQALEDAAIPRKQYARSPTGVFIGITSVDYTWVLREIGPDQLDGYAGPGTALNAAAGRLSYVLGLHGPCMALDTACSSSLVAVHLACRALRSGECGMALAGGVNLMLSPVGLTILSKAGALAPDGRCKTFDESADGYGRGEGCGVVVPEASVGCAGRGRPDPGGGARFGGQSRRCGERPDGTQRSGPGGAAARGLAGREGVAGRRRPDRNARHRNEAWRPDRGEGAWPRILHRGPRPAASAGCGEEQLRSPGSGGRDHRPDQGGAVSAP